MLAFRVLGPLSLTIDGREVRLPSVRQRRLLAALLLRVGRPVPMSALVDAVWGEDPPPSAVNTAQSYVSRLRVLLGPEALAWTGTGYQLRVDPAAVDGHRFEALVAAARSDSEPTAMLERLDAALALGDGEAYPELAHHEPAAAEAARLAELRLTAHELRAEALLAAGRDDDAVAALRALTVAHPLRERPWSALMRSLHRTGRQADALAAFRRYADLLADQGLEPAASVRDLRDAILAAPESIRSTVRPEQRGDNRPAQLPAPTAAFVGRSSYVDHLDRTLAEGSAGALVVTAVAGSAGIGKTALAIQWAHRVRDRFPDGQLFVDLRGYATGPPVRPIDALTGFLSALGVAAEQAPVRLDQATALFRTLCAGRRLLIVLDNARSPDQVRPLLPGEPDCLVLVTSRDRLGGLVARDGARVIRLDALEPDEAVELLTHLLGAVRVKREPKSTMDLARACALLPLALRVAAANLTWEPTRPIGDYVTRLHQDRLTTLSIEGDPDSAVGAAFDASYRVLPAAAQRLFRLLGLVPGPDITPAAAAALADRPEAETAALLERLAAAHLLDRPAPGRYAGHDLLRCYAADRCAHTDPAADRAAALRRLATWYLDAVVAAADLLYPHMLRLPAPPPRSEARKDALQTPGDYKASFLTPIADHASALAWLDAERPNLVAIVRRMAEEPGGEPGWRLADALRGYFHLRRHTADWIAVAECALAAAASGGDGHGQAAARHSLGTAYRSLGDLPTALGHYARALRLSRQCGWLECEATILGNLGIVRQGQGRLKAAVGQLTRALELDRRSDRAAGLANNLGNLASVLHDLGRLDEAAAHFSEALELNRRTGSRHGQALALTGLGDVYRTLGRADEATARLTEAMDLYTQVGDRDGQAVVHQTLGAVECDLGRFDSAREHAQAALALCRETGDPRTESYALAVLGRTMSRLGRAGEAAECYRRAYDVAQPFALPRAQIEALIGMAGSALDAGDLDRADARAETALHRARRSGFRLAEAQARDILAGVLIARLSTTGRSFVGLSGPPSRAAPR